MNFNYLKENRNYKLIIINIIGVFLIGLGYISIIPMFEGFDETAHYSRIREIKNYKASIFESNSFIDNTILDYKGPLPYSSGKSPFDSGNTYYKFWNNSELISYYDSEYRTKNFTKVFISSAQVNWQIQHPPLYYLILGSLLNVIGDLSLYSEVFILRLISYLFAMVGMILAIVANLVLFNDNEKSKIISLGWIIIPIVYPMFFIEFCRIGNDSLCLLFVGLISIFYSFWIKDKLNYKYLIFVGVFLAFGMLNKALFIPIVIAFLAYISIYNFNGMKVLLFRIISIILPLLIISGPWYIYKFITKGDLGIGGEAAELSQSFDFYWTLFITNFQLMSFLKSLLASLVTFSWAGTWSLVRMSIYMYIPLVFFHLLIIYLYIRNTNSGNLVEYKYISLMMVFMMYLGMIVHILLGIAINGAGSSGGWYLYILIPFYMPVFCNVLYKLHKSNKYTILILKIFLLYSLFFHIAALWSHIALFAGCAKKDINKLFSFDVSFFCLTDLNIIFDRLSILVYPTIGFVSLILGFSLILQSIYFQVKNNSINFYQISN